jgi:hypothetical protein
VGSIPSFAAGLELETVAEHRSTTPIDQLAPHFADQDERGVVELSHLQELPRQRQLE